MKKTLWIVVLVLIVSFVGLQIYVRLPPIVRFKSAAEIAKLPVVKDSYPCLRVEREQRAGSLLASIRTCQPALNDDINIEQYEVDLRSGLFILRHTDLYLAGDNDAPLALTRAYNPWDLHVHAFGMGGNHSCDIFPTGDHFPYTYMDLNLGDGEFVRYQRISRGTGYADFVGEHRAQEPSRFRASKVRWNRDHWELTLGDGTWIALPDSYQRTRAAEGAPFAIRDGHGNSISLIRDARRNLTRVVSPGNRRIEFAYDANDRVIEARDDLGTVVDYSYNDVGRLAEVRQNNKTLWVYGYDGGYLISVQNGNRRTILSNQYSRGRISSLAIENGAAYHFSYLVSRQGTVDETVVTDPNGKTMTFTF